MKYFEYNLGSIFQSLDMSYSNGLTDANDTNLTVFQRYFFAQAKEKLNVDAVYFLRDAEGIPKIPMIYFSAMDSYNSERIAELHRMAWNMGEAPLLFIVLPDELLVYNNYTPPAPRKEDGSYNNDAGMFARIKKVSDLEEQRQQLLQFHRSQIETGEFWKQNQTRFNIDTRVDVTLMANLRAIRKLLLKSIEKRDVEKQIDDQLRCEIVHGLLGRSILIKYLEERTDSTGKTVFPNDFFGKFLHGAKKYTDVLADKQSTYTLFAELEERFNGDMFPLIENEKDVITQSDLTELQQFLLGTSELASQQMVIWPLYSFNAIPIQLISSIYELFFHLAETDPDKEKGTYYTPYHLVSMLMDEVLPWDGPYTPQRILDPACGSGIFLVEAYRRLVAKWIFTNQPESIGPNDLINIMKACIFGVDSNKEAIRIASFSLSLAMCDFLEPRTIWDSLQFPRLLHYNLFHNDFFDRDCEFEQRDYDIVIGNPPWESRLSPAAKKYIKNDKLKVSDEQIAQAFTWRAGDICPKGVICFLLPSKGFLFNRSVKAQQFRTAFFEKYDVSVIINFSAFRWVLFEHAAGPAVGVIYRVSNLDKSDTIFYCTPKPLYTIEDKRRFLIEPTNICRIPRELIYDDLIWRIAMWGGPRDMDLVHTLQASGTPLRKLLDENDMVYAEGYKKGNKKKTCDAFLGMPMLNAKTFSPGKHFPDALPKMTERKFECTVDTKRQIFQSPHLIIKQSHKGSRFLADVLSFDAVFNHSFLGVHGDERLLKYFCSIISSKVFVYYQIMTNRKWLVERDESEVGDIIDTPFPMPTTAAVDEAVNLFDRVIVGNGDLSIIDQFAYRQYKLLPYEISLIDDAIDYVYDYYSKKGNSSALSQPDNALLQKYSVSLQEVMQNTLGNHYSFSCCIYHGDAPLIIAVLDLSPTSNPKFSLNRNSEEMDVLLHKLDRQLLEDRSGSVFVKRNVRVYNKDSIYIVKPNQSRYWNFSAACRDADEIYADVIRAWRGENE
ncbi:N6_Mtase domain-containing protein [Ruminococcaceae bacterium BL-6]|nr:N6_Mtase domain-containing protein [Ruminococcaceae bacterium BL-6]